LSLEFKNLCREFRQFTRIIRKKSVKIRVTPHSRKGIGTMWRAAQVFAAKTALCWRLKTNSKLKILIAAIVAHNYRESSLKQWAFSPNS
jgi:hypothetical protein